MSSGGKYSEEQMSLIEAEGIFIANIIDYSKTGYKEKQVDVNICIILFISQM